MKKTFITVLRTMCVGAMALFAVSCYDDSALTEGLAGLKDRVDGIEARLDSLEKALNADVKTINTTLGTLAAADEKLAADIAAVVADVKKVNETLVTLDAADGTLDGKISDLEKALGQFKTEAEKQLAEVLAKIAVVDVKKNDAGNYVLTFATGETLVVAAADANANNTGLITTVEVEGVTYWAIVQADGTTQVLEAVVHPDTKLAFKVDPETNELLVSYDGTWEQTGVIVNDDTTINVVEDFVYTEGDEYVTVTVGGKEYQLPLYEADNSELTFGREEVYFAYGASKKLALASEGIAEYYVMSKPDGWKANIEGGKVVVTAPAKALLEIGAAEAEGELLVHATTETGACKVVKVDLVSGPAMKISYKDGDVTFFSALVETSADWWGNEMTDFVSVWFGMVPVEKFVTYGSFEAYMATQPEYLSGLTNVLQNEFQIGYVEGEVEEFEATMSLVDILENSWSGFEMEEGVEYLFWAAPQGTTTLLYDQAVYFLTDSYIEFAAADSTYNNVTFDANFWGADAYVVGAMSKSQFNDWVDEEYTYEMALEQTLMGSWQPGPFMNFQAGDLTAMGKVYKSGTHSIKVSEVMLPDYGMIPEVTPETDYFVWVLPYSANKPFEEYVFADLQISVCSTSPLVYNENLAAKVTVDSLFFNKAVITIVPPKGGKTAWELVTAVDFEETYVDPEMGDVDVDAILENFKYSSFIEEEYTEEYGSWFIKPSTKYYLMTYNVVAGEYSVTYEEFFTSPADPSIETPLNKQWMFESEIMDAMVMGMPMGAKYCFDLGVAFPTTYPELFSNPTTSVLAIDYGSVPEMGAPEGSWFPAFAGYGPASVVAADETSGVITWMGEFEIPYSDFDGETCTFDFAFLAEMFEMEEEFVVECTLAEEFVPIQAQ